MRESRPRFPAGDFAATEELSMRVNYTVLAVAIALLPLGITTATQGGEPHKRQTVSQRPPAVRQVSRRTMRQPARPVSHRDEVAPAVSGYEVHGSDHGQGYGHGHGWGGCGGHSCPPFFRQGGCGSCGGHGCCESSCCHCIDLFGWLGDLIGPCQRGRHGACAVGGGGSGGCGCGGGGGGGYAPYDVDGEAGMPPQPLKKLNDNGSPSDVPPPPKVPR